MLPTLEEGERILVNRLVFHFREPEIGDVVVFHPPSGATGSGRQCGVARKQGEACPQGTDGESEENFVKRIVAGPGDRLSIENGHAVVNGEVAEEDFIRPCGSNSACDLPREITIPADHYFMMGDNRGASDDSRYWGPVPRDSIIGTAVFTYWPPDRIGIL